MSVSSSFCFLCPLCSQFEEKFEEISGAEPSSSIPSTSGYDEHTAAAAKDENQHDEIEMEGQETHRICSDANAQQDFVSGIMKIVPEVDVSLICELNTCCGRKSLVLLFSCRSGHYLSLL